MKLKPTICTMLFIVVLIIILVYSYHVVGLYGVRLYDVIMQIGFIMWIMNIIDKFYKWIEK